MDPIQQFENERHERIRLQGSDESFQELSNRWLEDSMSHMYVYNFEWMGRPIIQYPQDVMAVQELIWEVKPDVVVETGIAHGGSLILSASMLALLDYCEAIHSGSVLDPKSPKRRVIGVDIDIRDHNRQALESHPMANRLTMIEGSSIDPETVDAVKAAVGENKRVIVFLDSMHTHDHVLAELHAYSNLVSEGSYCVVFDTFVENMPPKFFADRPWDVGNNPMTAVHRFLADHPHFELDRSMPDKLGVTVAPNGFLKRKSAPA